MNDIERDLHCLLLRWVADNGIDHSNNLNPGHSDIGQAGV